MDAASLATSPVVPALVGLSGTLAALIVRDVWITPYLARKKRSEEVFDRKEAEARKHHDFVRTYADPLTDATASLRVRLHEIIEKRDARYLLASAPKTIFLEYKKISTIYRIAALLSWIRAVRRERSYLDPHEASQSGEMLAIGELEKALADGGHVEHQRLDELLLLWRVRPGDQVAMVQTARLIDGERAEYLSRKGALTARDLLVADQAELAERCAEIVRKTLSVDVPRDLVDASVGQAAVIFGIKEAYIYRDWQTAIGDLLLQEDKGGDRRFSVMGFGSFEDMFLRAHSEEAPSSERRWFDRLQALIYDLDVTREGMFDARREQLRKLYICCIELENALRARSRSIKN
ncbi:MAG TPA: hypothetical protein VGO06_16425 [Bosea sp. (in: a-proteobacteria)]|uniref:hypothetical protein n=1 Tax=Bosea sp. (in: a-proteobacteria) TaxID=1871050 RepID=UPI002E1457A8|nr:hypothetical protein [Bosea sp. (in: a-proteobacteria)]